VIRKIILYLISATLLIGGGGYLYLRGSLPQVDGEVVVSGLSDNVSILRDANGVPHITATSQDDVFFGLGFVHAQDRLWQMEMNRRIGAGRLSEIFGTKTLSKDKFLRAIDVYGHAERTLPNLSQETQKVFAAYAKGVNAFLSQNDDPLPPEFVILGVKPEPWKPVDSLVWVKMMAWDLGGNWGKELLRFRLMKKLGRQAMQEFMPPYPGDETVDLPDIEKLYAEIDLDVEHLLAAAPPALPDGAGSNNWVVSGTRSETGKPLLANDPHLGLAAPALWYFAHLKAPGINAIGATLPGVPAIVLGRNQSIAWGFTNTDPDVQDLFIEKLVEGKPDHYLTPDGPKPFKTRTTTIKVKDSASVTVTLRETRHGPVISDVLDSLKDDAPSGHVLAFQWTALSNDDLTSEATSSILKASNWETFKKAVSNFHAPQQNMVYADVNGNIGYYAAGRVPLRSKTNKIKGLLPVPGWLPQYDWQGFIPFDELPHAFNPENGLLMTANHKITKPDYPHHITYDWTLPYRADRLSHLLGEKSMHSVASFKTIQKDTVSLMAQEFLPFLLKQPPADEKAKSVIELLKHWDGRMAPDRIEPLIFVAWMRELTKLVYADELGPLFSKAWDLRPRFMSNVLQNRGGQSRWCDDVRTSPKETCDKLITRALPFAINDLEKRFGPNIEAWQWGMAHLAHSDHQPFTKVPVLRDLFDIEVPSAGGTYTVNVGRHSINDEDHPFINEHAASLRAIYDLEDLDRSIFIHSTGQSGNPLSPHYSAFANLWSSGRYLPLTTRQSDYEKGAIGVLHLIPSR